MDHAVGVGVGERREPGGVIAENLGGHAAETEHHRGPNTGSCTTPARTSTPPPSIGCTSTRSSLLPEGGGQLVVGRADLVLAVQVELDRPGVGLVHQAAASALSTAGPPNAAAAATASAALAAVRVGTSGIR